MTIYRNSFISPAEVPYNSVYSTSTSQEFELGTILDLQDGRRFKYALNGAVALAPGLMTQAAPPTAHHTNIATGAVSAAGQKVITIDTTLSTALVKDEYAGGWIVINDETGEGQCYAVVSNTAGTTGTVTIANDLVTALDASSEFTLVRNPNRSVIVAPTTKTAQVTGIPLVAVPAASYCWLQVSGPAPCLVDTGDTVVVGSPVGEPGTRGDAGACGVVGNDGTDNVWGVCMVVNAATEYAVINLTLV